MAFDSDVPAPFFPTAFFLAPSISLENTAALFIFLLGLPTLPIFSPWSGMARRSPSGRWDGASSGGSARRSRRRTLAASRRPQRSADCASCFLFGRRRRRRRRRTGAGLGLHSLMSQIYKEGSKWSARFTPDVYFLISVFNKTTYVTAEYRTISKINIYRHKAHFLKVSHILALYRCRHFVYERTNARTVVETLRFSVIIALWPCFYF